MSKRQLKIIKILILLGSILAAVKIVFVDYSLDEEYQIVMAYRRLYGDALFDTMWEPHQTSAFLCVFFMRIYHALIGSYTGVLIYLRICTLLIQIGLSVWIYRAFRRLLDGDQAFFLAMIYFNTVPKLIQIPEFGNMQVWFWTVILLSLMEYDMHPKFSGNRGWILLSGVAMALEVLSYPATLLLFPFFLGYLFLHAKEKKWVDPLVFAFTCAACATIWLIAVLSKVPLAEFMENVHFVLEFDLTHDLDVTENSKLLILGEGLLEELMFLAIGAFVAGGILLFAKRVFGKMKDYGRQETILVFTILWICAEECIQLFYWGILQSGYQKPQVHLFAVQIVSFLIWRLAGNGKRVMLPGMLSGVLTLLAVLYMSDLGFWHAIPHALMGTICGLAVIVMACREQLKDKANGWIALLLISFVMTAIFGKGFTLRSGKANTVLGVGGVMHSGPAVGVFTDYMKAYIYNSNREDFAANLEPGSKCLIVVRSVYSVETTSYLFDNYEVCHFSIVDPTSYDERLLAYWERYPEKRPETIIVECWYGGLLEESDSWMMQYIEKEFGYSEVVDGKYVRFYKK